MQVVSSLQALATILFASVICYGINKYLNHRVLGANSKDLWKWNKEIVLITGGSSGMGAEMVQQFALKNIKVVSFDINPPKDTLPPNAHFYKVNISSPEAIHEAAEKVRREIGEPSVLINNAGVVLGKAILDCKQEKIKNMFDVNILAHFWLVQEFLPSMIKRNHGHIVSMASIASFISIAGNIDYSCTKAAVLAFHEGLGQDLKHRYNASNIRTSIVHPYWVRTPLIKNLIEHPTFHDPLMEPDYVADVIVRHLLGGESGKIILPGYYGILSGMRGWPMWLQEFVRDSKRNFLRDTTF